MNLVGQIINDYKFTEALDTGNFADVYQVHKAGATYAAKVLSDKYVLQEMKNDKNRINQEIQILKVANHPSLIKYIDDFSFTDNFGVKIYVIIMEYFEGITLDKYRYEINDMGVLTDIFVKILDGVKQLHNTLIDQGGIVHRDIKPANIMVNEDREIKIIDYGLSKIIDFSTITSTGAQIGSPLYMSPEQLKDSKRVDYRSDIYSLGIILYELVTRNIPYKASTVPELLLKILNEPITPPKQYNSNITKKLEQVIYKATEKERYARYQSVDEFKDAFLNDEDESEAIMTGKYYAWVYKEKDVTSKFDSINAPMIIYPIHVKNWSKGLHAYFRKDQFKRVIIDPSTQRLSYLAFAATVGLTKLPYAPEKGVISLEYLQDYNNRCDYLDKWYSEVKEGQNLILPYHYISNSDYSVENIEDWIKINIKLIQDSERIVDSQKKKYAMISIGLNHLVFQNKALLSYYSQINVDGYIVQIADLRQLNEQSLVSYIDFVLDLQKYTNKQVIALKVPISLGLSLVARGLHGFSLGLASIDYFDEQYIKSEVDSFNLYTRFYFPQVLSFLTYPKKDIYVFEQLCDYFGSCECIWCKGKSAIEIGFGEKGVQLHFWQSMFNEVTLLNQMESEEKIRYIKERISIAISNFDAIPKNILSSQKNNDYYKLLKNLEKVM